MPTSGDRAQDVLKHFRNCAFSKGEIVRVRQLVNDHGKSLILSYDQFVEHDSRHLEAGPDAGSPHYIMDLALKGRYTGILVHYGLASRYWPNLEGAVPVIVKVNGKTGLPREDQAFSAHTSFVEDAVRVGAAAVGYTMHYGSPREHDDLRQLASVRRECERFGMPLVIAACPGGEAVEKKGGRETSYALESAARMAVEMGATIVTSGVPSAAGDDFLDNPSIPAYYRELERDLRSLSDTETLQTRCDRIVQAAQGVPVLFSGGSRLGDEDLVYRADICVKAGCLGFIFGRNMWKRERSKAFDITEKLRGLLSETE